MEYRPRIVDTELDALLEGLPAVSLEGPKAVGKTETALRRARTVHQLDDPAQLEIVRGAPSTAALARRGSSSSCGSSSRFPPGRPAGTGCGDSRPPPCTSSPIPRWRPGSSASTPGR